MPVYGEREVDESLSLTTQSLVNIISVYIPALSTSGKLVVGPECGEPRSPGEHKEGRVQREAPGADVH